VGPVTAVARPSDRPRPVDNGQFSQPQPAGASVAARSTSGRMGRGSQWDQRSKTSSRPSLKFDEKTRVSETTGVLGQGKADEPGKRRSSTGCWWRTASSPTTPMAGKNGNWVSPNAGDPRPKVLREGAAVSRRRAATADKKPFLKLHEEAHRAAVRRPNGVIPASSWLWYSARSLRASPIYHKRVQ